MNLYLFSGLGADHRAFSNLHFPSYLRPCPVEWKRPERKESLQQYAARIGKDLTNIENSILLGASFGGMVAVEVAKLYPPKKLIFISSLVTWPELPPLYRLGARLHVNKLLPYRFLVRPNPFIAYFFGIRTASSKALLYRILRDTDPQFLRWAVEAILQWRNKERPPNCFQLHGTKDKLLPHRFTKADRLISDGGHFMLHEKGAEISEVLLPVWEAACRR